MTLAIVGWGTGELSGILLNLTEIAPWPLEFSACRVTRFDFASRGPASGCHRRKPAVRQAKMLAKKDEVAQATGWQTRG